MTVPFGSGGPPHETAYSLLAHLFWHVAPVLGPQLLPHVVGSSDKQKQLVPEGSLHASAARATPHAPGPPSFKLAGQVH